MAGDPIKTGVGDAFGVHLSGLNIVQASADKMDIVDATIRVDPAPFINRLNVEDRRRFGVALLEAMPASDYAELLAKDASVVFDDKELAEGDFSERGMKALDVIVAAAVRIKRIPDDYQTPSMRNFDIDLDRLHEAIVEGRRDDAVDILNGMEGERFRSVREMKNLFPERIP